MSDMHNPKVSPGVQQLSSPSPRPGLSGIVALQTRGLGHGLDMACLQTVALQ